MNPSGPCLLVVDDDREIRAVLRQLFSIEGYQVVEARDGAEAMAKLQGGLRPALILLDLIMPRVDGRAFRAWQREEPALREIPVLLLSGEALEEAELRALGCAGQLPKMLDVDLLLQTVRQHCRTG